MNREQQSDQKSGLKRAFYFGFTLLVSLIIAVNCATPVAPSGGPPDRQGPEVIETTPEVGTTNFSGDEVRFTFDQFVDRNSVRQNVSIEPDLAIPFEVNFSRKTAIISFEEDLPENTTLVVKLGLDVTDTQRNKMSSSFDLALSTGDVLDEGSVTAKVLDAETGAGESGRRVFLYREPVDFSSRANYVAESDTSGVVNFGYLSEGEYRAIWVNDVNRNRIWEQQREDAQPFSFERFELQQNGEFDLGTLFVSMPDTVAPVLEGVGLLSERRLRIRNSEEVEWSSNAFITIEDTLGSSVTTAYPLYKQESDATVFFAESEQPMEEGQFFTVLPNEFSDLAGNSLEVNIDPFVGSSEPDTSALRPISHNSENGLFPDEPLEITYSKFIDDDTISDSLLVFEGDQMFEDWPNFEIERHILRVSPKDSVWESGLRYEIRVWDPWESEYLRINPEIWQRNQLGSIEFTIENARDELPLRLRVQDVDRSIVVDTTFTGSMIEIENLPPLEYRAVIYQDENENNKWDFGSVEPYQKPEPYVVQRSIPVREGFTSETEITFPNRDAGSIELPQIPEIETENSIEDTTQNDT
ncbi:Ig-like domain-containing protein [Rhodohalobacter sp.]|uniref:Ig-like domain-containing protein n=1 Tax=Rhodohalobacter sp. TaxID=1974210 RepID=UPI002ACF04A8|nr:Ig-like domain-containing protein [Rhodohalobacter sp.]MDZ7757407.1 Ig-like domain-containing protein [Rhodohalobacter sp.]